MEKLCDDKSTYVCHTFDKMHLKSNVTLQNGFVTMKMSWLFKSALGERRSEQDGETRNMCL